MFKSKKRKEQEQLKKDIEALWEAYHEDGQAILIDPFTGEEYTLHPEDLAYQITIAKDLDASPRNWARFDRLIAYIGDTYDG